MRTSTSQFAHPRGARGRLAGAVMAIQGRQRNAFAVAVLEIQPGDRVLEIGFGPGVTIQQLATLVGDGSVAGIDRSAVMMTQARRRNARAIQEGRVDLRQGSVERLPFADAEFDRVLAANSFHHWPNPIANLWEVMRVLKPGGRLVIAQQPVWTARDADDVRFAHDLTEQVETAGLAHVETVSRRMWPAPTICVRSIKSLDAG
jgi:SAM-dependent methyltransferase